MWLDDDEINEQIEVMEQDLNEFQESLDEAQEEVEDIESEIRYKSVCLLESKNKVHSLTYAVQELSRRLDDAKHPTRGLPTPLLELIEKE